MMDPVSAATSAIAITEAIIKIGKTIYQKYKDYREALSEIQELFVQFKNSWFKVQEELEILQSIMNALEGQLVMHLHDQLSILLEKFRVVSIKLDVVIKDDGSVSRAKYAFWVKRPLVRAVEDLENWTRRFYPSWFATARELKSGLQSYLPTTNLGQSQPAKNLEVLRRALRLTDADAHQSLVFVTASNLANRNVLDESSAELAAEYDAQGSHVLLIDGPDNTQAGYTFAHDRKDVEQLSAKLSTVSDPSMFGLMQCRGVLQLNPKNESNRLSCSFVFHVPEGLSKPSSLRKLLSTRPPPPINGRLELARRLARSVMFVQNYEFVHKNIRPETVIVFEDASEGVDNAFLTGFQYLRAAAGPTLLTQESDWARDLYRHPARQGDHPIAKYFIQHDIYSLGVCLLEIGLWSSFVLRTKPTTGSKGDSTSLGPDLPISDLLKLKDQLQRAWQIKDTLYNIAEDTLPIKMGNLYTDIVLSCLSSWEDKSSKFGLKAEFQQHDGMSVSIRYLEKVLEPLEEMVL